MTARVIKGVAGARGDCQHSRYTLTHAQIIALKSAPLEILASPGTGYAIVVERIYVCSNAAGGAYTEQGADDNINVEYTGGGTIATIETTGLVTETTVQVRTQAIAASVVTPVAAKGITLNNPNDELGGGDAANTLTVEMDYRVMDAA